MSGPGDRLEPLAVSLWHRVRGSVRLQQRPAREPGDRRRPRVHRRRRGQAALPEPRSGRADVETRPASRLQGPAGFFRHRLDAAGGGPAADPQRRRAGRTVCRRPRHRHGPRGVAGRQEWGPSYASPIPATMHGKRRVFVFAGGESEPPDRRLDVDRSGERPGRLRVSLAQPHPRFGQRLLPGRVRQQGVRLGELSHRERAGRGAARLHAPGGLDHAGGRAALQYGHLSGRSPLRVRRAQRARRRARVRRRGQR